MPRRPHAPSFRPLVPVVAWLAVSCFVVSVPVARCAEAPVVFWANDPVGPGDAVHVVGHGFGSNVKVEIARLADTPTNKPTPENTAKNAMGEPIWPNDGSVVEVIKPTAQSFRLVVPEKLASGMLLLQITTDQGTTVHRLNRPQTWWAQGDLGMKASPGGWIRAFGKNLAPAKASAETLCAIARLSGPKTLELPVESDAFSARIALPADVPPGNYALTLHNGHGGAAGWSEPVSIAVGRPTAWPDTVFNVKDFGALGDGKKDDTFAVATALEKASQASGGVVYFPRGRYRLSDGLTVPRFTVLRGAKRELVALCWTDLSEPPEALVRGTNSFGLEDLTIYAREHRHVIAGDLGAEPESGDVFLRRVLVRASLYRGHPKPEEVDEKFRNALRLSTGGGDTVRLGGPNIEITDCDFYGSGRALFLSKVRSGRVANNHFYNGRWGWYCISGSNGLIFENNTITGGDLMSTGGGMNCLDGSSSSENVYYADNTLRLFHGWDREAMTSDAGGEIYIGKVAAIDGCTVTLAEDPKPSRRDWVGAGVFILDGRGAGQYRRVTGHEGRNVQVDRPWLVAPDAQSDLSITMFQGRYMLLRNTFTDTGAMQFYGTSIECLVADNRGTRMSGFRGLGLWYHGYQPSWFCQFLDNEITEGNYYHWTSGTEAKLDIYGAHRGEYEGPLNCGAVVRGNRLLNNAHIRVSGSCRDVLVDQNHVADNDLGIFVSNTVENALVRANTFQDVENQVVDEEAIRRAAIARMNAFLGRQEPVAAWNFEKVLNKAFPDTTDNGFPARIEGNAKQVADGVLGKAVRLDGESFLRVDEPAVFNAPNITVSAWVRPEVVAGRRGLVVKRLAGAASPFVISQYGKDLRFEATEDEGPWTFNFGAPTDLKPGQWTQVVAVVEQGVGVSLYADGKPIGQIENKAPRVMTDQPLILGREAWGGDPPSTDQPGFFIGSIDEVRIWTRALSPKEIAEEYERVNSQR